MAEEKDNGVKDPKDSTPPQTPKEQVVETGFLVMMPSPGAAVIGDLTWDAAKVTKLQRPASFDDMYRMVCDLKSILDSMRNFTMWENKMKDKAIKQAMDEARKGPQPQIVKPNG